MVRRFFILSFSLKVIGESKAIRLVRVMRQDPVFPYAFILDPSLSYIVHPIVKSQR